MAEVVFTSGGFGLGGGRFGPSRNVVGIELLGSDALMAEMRRWGDRATRKLALGLFEVANEIMTDAKLRTPVDTGALRASGHVQRPVTEGQAVSVTLGFGGDPSDAVGITTRGMQGPVQPGHVLTRRGDREPQNYAVYVHEDLTKRHPVGEAKFLENAMLAKAPHLESQLAIILYNEWERRVTR